MRCRVLFAALCQRGIKSSCVTYRRAASCVLFRTLFVCVVLRPDALMRVEHSSSIRVSALRLMGYAQFLRLMEWVGRTPCVPTPNSRAPALKGLLFPCMHKRSNTSFERLATPRRLRRVNETPPRERFIMSSFRPNCGQFGVAPERRDAFQCIGHLRPRLTAGHFMCIQVRDSFSSATE